MVSAGVEVLGIKTRDLCIYSLAMATWRTEGSLGYKLLGSGMPCSLCPQKHKSYVPKHERLQGIGDPKLWFLGESQYIGSGKQKGVDGYQQPLDETPTRSTRDSQRSGAQYIQAMTASAGSGPPREQAQGGSQAMAGRWTAASQKDEGDILQARCPRQPGSVPEPQRCRG